MQGAKLSWTHILASNWTVHLQRKIQQNLVQPPKDFIPVAYGHCGGGRGTTCCRSWRIKEEPWEQKNIRVDGWDDSNQGEVPCYEDKCHRRCSLFRSPPQDSCSILHRRPVSNNTLLLFTSPRRPPPFLTSTFPFLSSSLRGTIDMLVRRQGEKNKKNWTLFQNLCIPHLLRHSNCPR